MNATRRTPVSRAASPLFRRCAVVLVLALCPLLVGFGDSPEARNRRGNRYYRESKYDEALTEYRSAQVLAPELPALSFNAGDALFRKGELADAVREFEKATAARDSLLSSSAYYNAGNGYVGVGDIGNAIESYKQALRRNPGDVDAKYNLELALKLLEQQQQQQEGQQGQEQDKEQDKEQQNQEQNGGEQEKDQPSDEQEQEKSDQEQGEDEEKQNGSPQEQEPEGSEGEEEPPAEQEQEQRAPAMTEEEAERLLDAIDEAERELQAELRSARARKRVKVEKDW